ncbi:hypothetical protein [Calditerricola satsumensis]|nr:hypothetical protein [Calditerricola satsumensis]
MNEIGEFDVVKLKDGREGTVVEVYDVPDFPLAYEVEFDDGSLETVQPSQIDKVIWKAKR